MPKTGKQNTLQLVAADGGFNIAGFIPFSDFTAEKDGKGYAIWQTPDGKTVPQGTPGAIEVPKQATAHRDLNKAITETSIVWPDGKIRTLRMKFKANDPMSPDEFLAKQSERQIKAATAAIGKMSPEQRKAAAEALLAELAALEGDDDGDDSGE